MRGNKSSRDIRDSVGVYRQFHGSEVSDSGQLRKRQYQEMVNDLYFNLVTDFYEFGWGRSFHFADRHAGEGFRESLIRLERRAAAALDVKPGDRVVDVGCGVGGPAQEIARCTAANISGLNLSDLQIERARRYARKAGLSQLCEFVHGDFMQMPFADASFAAAYTLCALPHAPDKAGAYREIARVLRPGGALVGTDWCLTHRYDPQFPRHRDIKRRIQLGSALPDIDTVEQLRAHLDAAGFDLLEFEDLAEACDPETPWYLPLSSAERSFRGLLATPYGRLLTKSMASLAETVRLLPRGAAAVAQFLSEGAEGLVDGGREGIFTIVYYAARKRDA